MFSTCRLCFTKTIRNTSLSTTRSKGSIPKPATRKIKNGQLIISCRRPTYDFYAGQTYQKFDEIVLASKGWTHNQSKGDYFIVHPCPDAYELEPRKSFNSMNDLHPDLIKCLHNQGIIEITAFQDEAISKVFKGKHTILAAETGCGKTIAYLLPIIQKLIDSPVYDDHELNTPKALILVPNRELAQQVGVVAEQLAAAVGLKVKSVVGGRTKQLMLNPDFCKIDILVGTPGAIGKLTTVGIFRLNKVQYTILDEADTLMDDSFTERMSTFLHRVAISQIILVSATLPKKFPDIFEPIMQDLVKVTSPLLHKPLLNVTQRFLRLTRSAKPAQLLPIVKANKNPMLIFTNRNETCNWLAMFLRENNVPCSNINGDMNYAIRIEQWRNFVSGHTNILSATDVGSRGLDTLSVKHVLNYDFPIYAADYIHRVGRTGRFGSPEFCKVTNFISGSEEVRLVQQIELAIRTNEEIPHVDGNITNIVQKKILRKMRETG